MLYIGNNKIIKGYIGNTPVCYIGMGANELIKIGDDTPLENIVAIYTVSGTSAVSPYSVTNKASDWLETCKDNGDGTSTMTITASTPPTAIRFQNIASLLSVEYLDISELTTMQNLFSNCTLLTTVNTTDWDINKVTNMSNTFSGCDSLTMLDLSNWDMSHITNTSGMLSNCTSLHTLRLDNCNGNTINGIITSYLFPTKTIQGVTRKIYCKQANARGLTPPTNWKFEYIE